MICHITPLKEKSLQVSSRMEVRIKAWENTEPKSYSISGSEDRGDYLQRIWEHPLFAESNPEVTYNKEWDFSSAVSGH